MSDGKMKWVFLALAAASPCFAGFVYILNNNSSPGTSGSVAVYDETTLMPFPGSPFTTVIPGTSGQAGQDIAINAAGTRLYVANELIAMGNLSVLETGTFLPIAGSPFTSGGANSASVAVNPVFPYLYLSNYSSDTVSRLDEGTYSVIGAPVPSGGMNPTHVLVNPNGAIVYVMNSNTPNVVTFDADLNPLAPSITPVNFGPVNMALNPAGTILYLYGYDTMAMTAQVLAYDAMTLALISNPAAGHDGNEVPSSIVISPDGNSVYTLGRIVAPPNNYIVRLDADPASLAILTGPTVTGGASPFAIAINPAGTRLYVGETDTSMVPISQVSLFDPLTLAALPGSPLTSGIFGPISFAFSPLLTPPANLQGSQKKNDFALVYEYFNLLTWDASTRNAAGYFVYRDGVKIATLGASALSYEDHDRPKGAAALYSVTAFDDSGFETAPISTVVQ